jgi:transcriptional regulator with XRE-family HTH domain
MGRRKRRQPGRYTAVGRRMRTLGKQTELAKVLKVSQQTISKKLRGEVVITLRDIETLAKKFRKPLCFFDMSREDCAKVAGKGIHLPACS